MPEPVLTEELNQLLAPYNDLLGDLTDEQIAEQLELAPAIVSAYRASLAAAPGADQEATEAALTEPSADTVSTSSPGDPAPTPEAIAIQKRSEEASRIAGAVHEILEVYVQTGAGPGGTLLADALTTAFPQAPQEAASAVEGAQAGERSPRSVRVVKKRRIRGPNGRAWVLGFRDIYSGEQAAWLWAHHRTLVEPYAAR